MKRQQQGILEYFPAGKTPRPLQKEVLQKLESNWKSNDVFVVNLPTGVGKSAISMTISRWLSSRRSKSVILTPSNLLREQYTRDYPRLHTLGAAGSYKCHDMDDPDPARESCARRKQLCRVYCSDCPYKAAKRKAYALPYGVYNNYTYMANKLFVENLIADEAHNLVRLIADMQAKVLWHHDYKYPNRLGTYKDLLDWVRPRADSDPKLAFLLRELEADGRPRFIVENGEDLYRGETRPCLKLLPVDTSDAPPILWPQKVNKIVLLSATIGPPDIKQLGLDKRRVLHLGAASPIPAANRPIVYSPVGAVTVATQVRLVPGIAERILQAADTYGGPGLVHTTYRMAEQLRATKLGRDPRVLFHTQDAGDKAAAYVRFRNAPPSDGLILIGCGMREGVDLAYDAARWQVITKMPWPNLEEPAIRWQSIHQPEQYMWSCARDLLQMSGRVVRAVDDTGATIILDRTFDRLLDPQWRYLLPDWYIEAIQEEDICRI